jgi:hypothetical protein
VPAFGFDAPDPENWVIAPAPEGNAVLICMLITGSGNANDAIAFQASRLFGASVERGAVCGQSNAYVLVSAVPLPSDAPQLGDVTEGEAADEKAPGNSGNAPGRSGEKPGKGSSWKDNSPPGRGGG